MKLHHSILRTGCSLLLAIPTVFADKVGLYFMVPEGRTSSGVQLTVYEQYKSDIPAAGSANAGKECYTIHKAQLDVVNGNADATEDVYIRLGGISYQMLPPAGVQPEDFKPVRPLAILLYKEEGCQPTNDAEALKAQQNPGQEKIWSPDVAIYTEGKLSETVTGAIYNLRRVIAYDPESMEGQVTDKWAQIYKSYRIFVAPPDVVPGDIMDAVQKDFMANTLVQVPMMWNEQHELLETPMLVDA